jgi:hypothetical protein
MCALEQCQKKAADLTWLGPAISYIALLCLLIHQQKFTGFCREGNAQLCLPSYAGGGAGGDSGVTDTSSATLKRN